MLYKFREYATNQCGTAHGARGPSRRDEAAPPSGGDCGNGKSPGEVVSRDASVLIGPITDHRDWHIPAKAGS
jgi:hypothetical protein